ncbi:hypothetical protein NDU88_006110 [Pleurodeles waltl]|uniref:Uncharacterized protein n=1 Tax=Pleurodeles waltl TaxID=8319 RepID=A0AAV7TCI2_PLEWA|nr:hypothetical protein NDU88_006110 [Pleurodeles waltl]
MARMREWLGDRRVGTRSKSRPCPRGRAGECAHEAVSSEPSPACTNGMVMPEGGARCACIEPSGSRRGAGALGHGARRKPQAAHPCRPTARPGDAVMRG